jgi:hypothetical protein
MIARLRDVIEIKFDEGGLDLAALQRHVPGFVLKQRVNLHYVLPRCGRECHWKLLSSSL